MAAVNSGLHESLRRYGMVPCRMVPQSYEGTSSALIPLLQNRSTAIVQNATELTMQPHPTPSGTAELDTRQSAIHRVLGAIQDHDELCMQNAALRASVTELLHILQRLQKDALAVVAENRKLAEELQAAGTCSTIGARDRCAKSQAVVAQLMRLLDSEAMQTAVSQATLVEGEHLMGLRDGLGQGHTMIDQSGGRGSQAAAKPDEDEAEERERSHPASRKPTRQQRRRRAARARASQPEEAQETCEESQQVDAISPTHLPLPTWASQSSARTSGSSGRPVARADGAGHRDLGRDETQATAHARTVAATPAQQPQPVDRPRRSSALHPEGADASSAASAGQSARRQSSQAAPSETPAARPRAPTRTVQPLMPLPCAALAA
mmetsp:Transcript_45910/g.109345  ORF Transcript_45910/g.109345 Transcript_45910/m.109345 type:complete len:379 (+) Transcript_45910:102-1238(+)